MAKAGRLQRLLLVEILLHYGDIFVLFGTKILLCVTCYISSNDL